MKFLTAAVTICALGAVASAATVDERTTAPEAFEEVRTRQPCRIMRAGVHLSRVYVYARNALHGARCVHSCAGARLALL